MLKNNKVYAAQQESEQTGGDGKGTVQQRAAGEAATAKKRTRAEASANKAAAKKEKEAAGEPNGRGRVPHPLDATIKLLDDACPHRKDTNDFKKWTTIHGLRTKTVEKALEAKVDRGYLHYMEAKGKMKIG